MPEDTRADLFRKFTNRRPDSITDHDSRTELARSQVDVQSVAPRMSTRFWLQEFIFLDEFLSSALN